MRISDWSSDVCSSDLKEPKGFGGMAQIEGGLDEGQRVLLVEDLTTDGGSKAKFVHALRQAGATVDHTYVEIGRASCRDRVCQYVEISVVAVTLKNKESVYK